MANPEHVARLKTSVQEGIRGDGKRIELE